MLHARSVAFCLFIELNRVVFDASGLGFMIDFFMKRLDLYVSD